MWIATFKAYFKLERELNHTLYYSMTQHIRSFQAILICNIK